MIKIAAHLMLTAFSVCRIFSNVHNTINRFECKTICPSVFRFESLFTQIAHSIATTGLAIQSDSVW